MLFRNLRAAVVLALLTFPGWAHAASFDAVYFFGDSITDTGNFLAKFPDFPGGLQPENGYYKGRAQAGPGWADYFDDLVGGNSAARGTGPTPAGTNYAVAGAFSGLFDGEVGPVAFPNAAFETELYLSTQLDTFFFDFPGGADPDALYSLQIGSNDFLNGSRTLDDAPDVAGNLIDAIVRLRDAGAQQFTVANMASTFGADPGFDAFSASFNAALDIGLSALEADGLDIAFFDTPIFQVGLDISGFQFGACTDDPDCLAGAIEAAIAGEPFEHDYLTFDGTHSNTKIHEQIALFSAALFEDNDGPVPDPGGNPVPEPGTATLLLVGVALLASRRRAGV